MFALTKGQKCRLRMTPKDANGAPAAVEPGSAKWESSDPAVLKITGDAEGLTAIGEAVGHGVATVTATADASLEPNLTTEITAITNIGVQDAEAMTLEIQVSHIDSGARPSHPIYYPPYPSTGPGFPTHPIQLPPWAGGWQPRPDQGLPPYYPGAPVYPSHPIYWPPYPSQGLPPFPSQGLPGNQPYPDQGLPGNQPRPDQGLPGSQPRPDQGLPGAQPKPDQGLPGSQPRPDQGLPPTAQPKK
jgi:hypothetical protein